MKIYLCYLCPESISSLVVLFMDQINKVKLLFLPEVYLFLTCPSTKDVIL